MSALRLGILGTAAALALSLPAAAQGYGYSDYDDYGYDDYGYDDYAYQPQQPAYYNRNCEAAKRQNQTAGGLVGAVAGGLIGAAIADDGDNHHRHRRHRYSRGWDRGYGYGYRGHRGHRGNDNDQLAGAVIGAIVGGVAGSAIAGSGTDCNTQRVYAPQQRVNQYGNMQVAPPTRQATGPGWSNNAAARPVYSGTYSQNQAYDVRAGEELYGGSPSYGATTTGYNAGYGSAGYDTGECRTVYRDRYVNGRQVSEPATACNVGGDRWEFVD